MHQTRHAVTDNDEIFIGRQPIFDVDMNVAAYELLYRNGQGNFAEITCQETATAEVLVNSFLEIGFDALVGQAKAFINIPRGLLLGEEIFTLPPDKVVLEILETVELDQPVADAMLKLREHGFDIALDDFNYHEIKRTFVEKAQIIKVDLLAFDHDELVAQVKILKQFDIVLLAEKVETKEDYLKCKAMGFAFFQGYYFCRPEIIKGTKTPANRLTILQLLMQLYDPEVTIQQLEKLISRDVSLSFKLLKIINSAALSTGKNIESIKKAITLLGLNRIRNWVSFIVFAGMTEKPFELFRMSMVRARMCELLATSVPGCDSDKGFTVGLFSNLDAFMDQPLDELINPLPLSDEVKTALLQHDGVLGQILSCVRKYESGDWDKITCVNVKAGDMKRSYIEAIQWAEQSCQSLAV